MAQHGDVVLVGGIIANTQLSQQIVFVKIINIFRCWRCCTCQQAWAIQRSQQGLRFRHLA